MGTQLWKAYLDERRLAVRNSRPDHPSRAALHNTYERALVSMHKVRGAAAHSAHGWRR